MNREIYLLRTGVANLASVEAAFERLGARVRIGSDPDEARAAQALVLPGVGRFGVAMNALRETGLDSVLKDRLESRRPLLAICLGLQLLGQSSAESPRARGLGAFDLSARPFPAGVRSPQLGWNRMEAGEGCRLLRSGWVAYANGFRFERRPVGWSAAWSDHGGRFIAALERGPQLACQFHPELSGALGADLLERWLQRALGPAGALAGGTAC